MSWLPDRRAAWLIAAVLLYGVNPVDLVPDALPVLGLLDDLGILGIAAMLVAWQVTHRRAEPAVAFAHAS